ncbi:MAG: hypothetical protein A2289_16025 [Deltaproteobacteria bacterium RIFOXYA12_FULL_58_15]|nr:MAG: hypothetical protein A2289_16025 [Deltaproteobacteria bacterium RIFOXYA12_FULL_58_15]
MYVTEQDGRLRGGIHLEDVSAVIRDEEIVGGLLIAADVMRPAPASVRPDDSLARTLRLLSRDGLESLPVVDEDHRLLGVVKRSEIIAMYDREVLRRDSTAMTFVDEDADDQNGHSASSILHVSKGEHVEDVLVTDRLAGHTLRQLNLRARYQVHVIGVRCDNDIVMPEPGEPLTKGDPENPLNRSGDNCVYGII